MHALAHEVAQGLVDHPLALDAGRAGECFALDLQREVTLPLQVVAAVPAMLLAVVDEPDVRRRKRRIEPPEYFSCDGSRGGCVYRSYIRGLTK